MQDGLNPRRTSAEALVDRHVGKCIKSYRLHAGLTQSVLAGRLGITHQQLQKYERGESRVSASRLWSVAKVLNIEISQFFDIRAVRQISGAPSARHNSSRETLELLRSYGRIKDASMRRRVRQLAALLARNS